MKHGNGTLYDIKGNIVFEGTWHLGKNNPSQLIIPSNSNENILPESSISTSDEESGENPSAPKFKFDENGILVKV